MASELWEKTSPKSDGAILSLKTATTSNLTPTTILGTPTLCWTLCHHYYHLHDRRSLSALYNPVSTVLYPWSQGFRILETSLSDREGPELLPHAQSWVVLRTNASRMNAVLRSRLCHGRQLGLIRIRQCWSTALLPAMSLEQRRGWHFISKLTEAQREPFQLLRWSAANSCAKFPCFWVFLASSCKMTVSQGNFIFSHFFICFSCTGQVASYHVGVQSPPLAIEECNTYESYKMGCEKYRHVCKGIRAYEWKVASGREKGSVMRLS